MTPSRQPLDAGGVRTTPSRTTKTLDPVASHNSSRVLGKMASPAPCSCAYASARTFSAYEIVFSPAVAPRSLRAHGTTTTAIEGATETTSLAATITVGTRVPPLRTERLHAAGDRDPEPRLQEVIRLQHRGAGFGQERPVGRLEAEAAGRVVQPVEVAPPREGPAVVDAQRLEHAVADEEAVVERGHASVVGRRELPVDPHEAHDGTSAPAPATARRRDALNSVSCHSSDGDESATMPAPTPSSVWSGKTVNVRIATARSPSRVFGVDPTERAAVHAAAHGLELFDHLQDARFRRARDRRRWKRRGQERAEPDVGAQRAADGAHEMVQTGVRFDARTATARAWIRARTRARGRCARGRRSSRSPRGPWRSPATGRDRRRFP